ncbi:ABC transporter substrate-binding protein [Oscillibacter valericigenes]|uniref:ABC transporter substrate-binding protein n=1 Tax=Oscillibacter valericigenes TaxID=351091 RepID=UPI001F38D8D6|nr:ABC transporter substrate-binding protein [Oscillibacter valericigenes]MCF2664543.1 ABC transporter substrate-binding protein [Oscillibacter valericigenes]
MKKRLTAFLLLAALLCAALTGCGGGSTEQTPAEKEPSTPDAPVANEITVGIAQDLDDSLDPHKTVKAGTREVMFNVFEGLVKPTPDGDLTPAVAENYTVSEDRLTYTFTLREGVKFHNGDTVTAEDVVYSINRCAAATETGIVQVEAFSVIQNIAAADERTVTITIAEPSNEFLSYLTVAVLPSDYDKQDTAPIGTGPFKFVSRAAQDSMVLEKFDEYWGTPANLDKVTLKIIENADSLMMSLQSGAIDLCSHLTSTQVAQLGDDFNVAEGTMNLVQAMYLNNAEKPFDDVRVRQALCYAVDKQAIIDIAFDGYGSPIGSSMYPAFGKYFDDSLTNYYTKDVDKAKALLADAGYPNGFEMTITVPSNYKPHMDTAEVLVQQLAEIGVKATIQPIEWESWVSDVYVGRQFQSTVVGVDASTMTARALLERFTSTYGKNFINYNSADYDALFQQVLSSSDDAEQTSLYKQMEQNLTENAANVYIQDLADLVAVRKGLEGVTFYPIYVLDLATIRYAK